MRFLLGAFLLAGCAPSAPDGVANEAGGAAPAPVSAPAQNAASVPSAAVDEARFLGRWTGVEGMFLDVRRAAGGGVTMEMQWDLDHRGTFPGSVTAKGLRFERNGVAEVASPSDGDATGLKYLAGKKDCLTVKPGEGYCRG